MIIVGAGNLGFETLAILLENGYNKNIIFYDTNLAKKGVLFDKYPVITNDDVLSNVLVQDKEFVVGVGHPRLRERMYKKLISMGGTPVNVISNKAHIFPFNKSFAGCIIQPGVGISHSTEIGECCAIHINCTIGHSVKIGKFVNVGPGVNIVGPCVIDDFAYISVGAVILPNTKIGKYAIVTANKLVSNDIADFETF